MEHAIAATDVEPMGKGEVSIVDEVMIASMRLHHQRGLVSQGMEKRQGTVSGTYHHIRSELAQHTLHAAAQPTAALYALPQSS